MSHDVGIGLTLKPIGRLIPCTDNIVQWLAVMDADNSVWKDAINGNDVLLVESNCINSAGSTVLTFSDLTDITITSYQGTATPSINGDTIEVTAGTLYDLLLSDGTYLPLAEGTGTDAYDVSGNDNHATVTNEAFTTQDDFHYNIGRGFQIDTPDTVKIPRRIDRTYIAVTAEADKYPAGNWHNAAETKIKQPVVQLLIDNDVDNYWFTVGEAPIVRAYSEILWDGIGVVTTLSNQLFANVYNDNKKLSILMYSDPITGSCLLQTNTYIKNFGSTLATNLAFNL